MSTTLFSLSLFIVLIQSVLAQLNFEIDTPNLVQCQPSQITWTATSSPPYTLLVVSAQDMCGVALDDLGIQNSTATTWTPNLAAGTQVVLFLEDAVDDEAWSGIITVGASNDTSCLSSGPSSGTTPTVPPSGGVASHTSASSSPTSTVFAPVGAAGSGLAPTSGAPSTRRLSAVTLLGSAVLVVVTFAL